MYCQFIKFGLILGLVSAFPSDSRVSIRSLKTEGKRGVEGSRLGIYDGESTTIEDHPYLAAILKGDEFRCAGAILSDQWVIVLGDCVYEVTQSKLKVVVGSSDGTTGTSFSVKKVIQHPDYIYDSFDYDFTLLKIKGEFTWGDSVANISLPSQDLSKNDALVVAGYGDTSSVEGDSVSSGTLMQGTMKWLKRSVCSSDYEDYEITFTDRMGCAYNKGKTTLCAGDWGDPFVKSGVLYGLYAAGASEGYCTSSARPVIVADLYPVVDWIQNYTGASLASALPRKDLKLAKPLYSRHGAETEDSRLGIYDGKSTTISQHPYLVAILVEDSLYCAGAILSDSWILTDGDCIDGLTKSDLSIVAGSDDGFNGTNYSVKKTVLHPSYDDESYSYDYGLIKIKGTFTWGDTVANVSLPSADPSAKTAFVVAGYGSTDYVDGSSDSSLLQGTMKWQANSTCASYYEDLFGWDESQACAYSKGKVTLCTGDFGDPFVKDGVLYGVAVGGLSTYFCTSEAWPVVIADVFNVVEWIQSYTGATIA